MSNPVRIAVVGATGYAGAELSRLLAAHPEAGRPGAAVHVSRSAAGKFVAEFVPALRGGDAVFVAPESADLENCDAVFFAAPQGVAMAEAPALLQKGVCVIDLGPDFRLRDPAVYEKWYGPHSAPDLLAEAVCGLAELAREEIRRANLIACPGCHATAVALAIFPLAKAGAIGGGAVVADSKTGVSGAGRRADRPDLLFSEMHANCKAYALGGHRHHPEIVQALAGFCDSEIVFVPHLLPLSRGILASVYIPLKAGANPHEIFSRHWDGEMFAEVLPEGASPELARLAFSNRVEFSAKRTGEGTGLVLVGLDNLMKGAAGQAVQNFNLRFGFAEDAGLRGGGLLQR